MEGSKTKIIIASVIVIILIIASIGIYLMNSGASGITAMEGREIADEVAIAHNNVSKLVYVHGIGEINSDGTAYKWRYTYANESNSLEVIIDSNGGYQMNELENPPSNAQIINWTLDSDKIIEIAYSNSIISQYLAEYRQVDLQSIAFAARLNSSVCSIEWVDWGFMDDPHSARIWIDATNGEVIDVEADN